MSSRSNYTNSLHSHSRYSRNKSNKKTNNSNNNSTNISQLSSESSFSGGFGGGYGDDNNDDDHLLDVSAEMVEPWPNMRPTRPTISREPSGRHNSSAAVVVSPNRHRLPAAAASATATSTRSGGVGRGLTKITTTTMVPWPDEDPRHHIHPLHDFLVEEKKFDEDLEREETGSKYNEHDLSYEYGHRNQHHLHHNAQTASAINHGNNTSKYYHEPTLSSYQQEGNESGIHDSTIINPDDDDDDGTAQSLFHGIYDTDDDGNDPDDDGITNSSTAAGTDGLHGNHSSRRQYRSIDHNHIAINRDQTADNINSKVVSKKHGTNVNNSSFLTTTTTSTFATEHNNTSNEDNEDDEPSCHTNYYNSPQVQYYQHRRKFPLHRSHEVDNTGIVSRPSPTPSVSMEHTQRQQQQQQQQQPQSSTIVSKSQVLDDRIAQVEANMRFVEDHVALHERLLELERCMKRRDEEMQVLQDAFFEQLDFETQSVEWIIPSFEKRLLPGQRHFFESTTFTVCARSQPCPFYLTVCVLEVEERVPESKRPVAIFIKSALNRVLKDNSNHNKIDSKHSKSSSKHHAVNNNPFLNYQYEKVFPLRLDGSSLTLVANRSRNNNNISRNNGSFVEDKTVQVGEATMNDPSQGKGLRHFTSLGELRSMYLQDDDSVIVKATIRIPRIHTVQLDTY